MPATRGRLRGWQEQDPPTAALQGYFSKARQVRGILLRLPRHQGNRPVHLRKPESPQRIQIRVKFAHSGWEPKITSDASSLNELNIRQKQCLMAHVHFSPRLYLGGLLPSRMPLAENTTDLGKFLPKPQVPRLRAYSARIGGREEDGVLGSGLRRPTVSQSGICVCPSCNSLTYSANVGRVFLCAGTILRGHRCSLGHSYPEERWLGCLGSLRACFSLSPNSVHPAGRRAR